MGTNTAPSQIRTAGLLLRGVALVYLVAFVSLAVQVEGLYGSEGILPVSGYLDWLGARWGADAWRIHPTLFWLGSSDWALLGSCWAGAFAAIALWTGWTPRLSAAVCWVLYFSLFQIGRVFLGFQWDLLLLEAGFLAIFLAPVGLRPRSDEAAEPSVVTVWMFRWLLFRLMFASGFVKLMSGDPTWWNLSALEYHYWTQPLPTWTAWGANLLPTVVQRGSVLVMFVIELGFPWFIFGPRRLRLVAFAALVLLQALIAATGNYSFLNLLTVVLCLSLLDDDALQSMLGGRRRLPDLRAPWPQDVHPRRPLAIARVALAALLALALATVGGAMMVARFVGLDAFPAPVVALVRALEPWHLTSSYGLFAVMTTQRREIVLEGSLDGVEWREYEMRWKPGDVHSRPRFVAPYQPRLDWQMWFASLGDWKQSPWLVEVEKRLLQGPGPVLDLFASDPFDGRPPRHVRAMLYDYRFTSAAVRGETDAWWTRRRVGQFSPTVSREQAAQQGPP